MCIRDSLDCGCYEVWNQAVPSAYDREGSQLFVAERLRKEGIRLPFLVQGKLNNPNVARQVVESGTAELVALGHQSLADQMCIRDSPDIIRNRQRTGEQRAIYAGRADSAGCWSAAGAFWGFKR